MNLELMAMRWLWLEKNCAYLLEERSPRYMIGQPDVLGVTKQRFLVEVEIKRSASDFAADARKTHRANREFHLKSQPKYFYYLMEQRLAEKMLPKIPEWAGLLSGEMEGKYKPFINVLKKAPINKESRRLSIKECVAMTRLMVNHMMSYVESVHTQREIYRNNDSTIYIDWTPPEVGTWEI